MKNLLQLNRILATVILLGVAMYSWADGSQGAKRAFGENLLQTLSDGRLHTDQYDDNSITITCPDNKHPHAIDLALPSGIKWSCCNVGASSPEEFGGYYAWSEAKVKNEYTWENYKYCVAWDGHSAWDWNRYSDHFYFTKYVTNSDYGDIDNKVVLELADDAAHVVQGEPWRMPSSSEMQELLENCQWQWVEYEKINGYQVIGSNGNSIFLPAAGSYNFGTSIDNQYDEGFYYTSSLYEPFCKGALYLYFSCTSKVVTVFDSYFDRRDGRTVRGITDVGNNEFPTDITTLTHDDENAPIYDLMGRRLANKPTKGVYILGGKKFFTR